MRTESATQQGLRSPFLGQSTFVTIEDHLVVISLRTQLSIVLATTIKVLRIILYATISSKDDPLTVHSLVFSLPSIGNLYLVHFNSSKVLVHIQFSCSSV